MLTSKERVEIALNHQEPDRVPLDLGGSSVTGMHVSSVYQLRQALNLDPIGTPVKVIDPFQMLGEIGMDLLEALGVDVVAIESPTTLFGYKKEGWKEWELFDGTPVLVACAFADPRKVARLREKNAEVIELPNDDGKVDLPQLLRELARRGVNELHVEAGYKLNGSLVREGCIDELLVYLAPLLLGEGQGMFDLPALEDLAQARRLQLREVTQVGSDVRVLARWEA